MVFAMLCTRADTTNAGGIPTVPLIADGPINSAVAAAAPVHCPVRKLKYNFEALFPAKRMGCCHTNSKRLVWKKGKDGARRFKRNFLPGNASSG